MTAVDQIPTVRRLFDHPDPIYPYTVSTGPDHCQACFQRKPDMALHVTRTDAVYRCSDCRRAITAGRALDLPTGTELVATWERLARLHHNRQMPDAELDAALTVLAPHLRIEAGRDAVAALEDAMLAIQHAEDPATVLDGEVGPEDDAETYVNRQYGLADDAMAKLTGGR